ncbi:amidohydrolase family protein [Microbacterium sp. NEAU-LLC]|uniref:Amidohydrolase family protein n=1 Tax=Microbacterium helvum TaxID=2773713 RepID=A0ABR8NWK1_9MICO|nr:amidohydrolase family protein [Microbacterium helvum]MBD3943451.1 amidohydrolase family protein [Microbacterium helvum]
MTIVDAHVHLWDLSRFSLSWFRDDMGLPRDASPADLRTATLQLVERAQRDETSQPDLSTGPVITAIAVQAGDTLPEMRWLLEVAATDPVVRSVVLQYVPGTEGWAGLATTVLNDRVRGIRVATPGGAAGLSDVPGLDALCEGAAASGRVIEWLVRPAQLDAVARVAVRHPRTTFILCHLGLGAADSTPEWVDSLGRVAAAPNSAAKLSGLVTGADDVDRLDALVATAFDAFGGDRLMFGSDWPMSTRVESYPRLVDRVERAWGTRPEALWSAVAARVYGM